MLAHPCHLVRPYKVLMHGRVGLVEKGCWNAVPRFYKTRNFIAIIGDNTSEENRHGRKSPSYVEGLIKGGLVDTKSTFPLYCGYIRTLHFPGRKLFDRGEASQNIVRTVRIVLIMMHAYVHLQKGRVTPHLVEQSYVSHYHMGIKGTIGTPPCRRMDL